MSGMQFLIKIGNWLASKFKFIETGLAAFVIVGILLKISAGPVGNLIFAIALSAASIIYFFYGFSLKDLVINDGLANFFNKLTGLSISILYVGVLYSNNHYTGAETMLKVSTITLLITIPLGFYGIRRIKELKLFYYPRIIRSAVYAVIGIIVMFLIQNYHIFT